MDDSEGYHFLRNVSLSEVFAYETREREKSLFLAGLGRAKISGVDSNVGNKLVDIARYI